MTPRRVLILAPLLIWAQQIAAEQPSFSTRIEAVRVDVLVTDRERRIARQ